MAAGHPQLTWLRTERRRGLRKTFDRLLPLALYPLGTFPPFSLTNLTFPFLYSLTYFRWFFYVIFQIFSPKANPLPLPQGVIIFLNGDCGMLRTCGVPPRDPSACSCILPQSPVLAVLVQLQEPETWEGGTMQTTDAPLDPWAPPAGIS